MAKSAMDADELAADPHVSVEDLIRAAEREVDSRG